MKHAYERKDNINLDRAEIETLRGFCDQNHISMYTFEDTTLNCQRVRFCRDNRSIDVYFFSAGDLYKSENLEELKTFDDLIFLLKSSFYIVSIPGKR